MNATKFHINSCCTVKEIQDRFTDIFPFLRINFLTPVSVDRKSTWQNSIFSPDSKMGDINKNLIDGEFEISDMMSVSDFENKLKSQFGLNVQVYRKCGNLWLEPTMTNSYTLKAQNDHGEAISPSIETPIYFKQVPFGC
ncbi:MAG: hypothetical protein JST75_21800 [Bacteroidetes bacterium]|nr:hypothetical protein [Bacteroidota bacterium]